MNAKFLHAFRLAGLFFLMAGISFSRAYATTLDIPLSTDEQTLWCWAASSQMVLGYYNITVSQSDIAAYGTNGQNVPNLFYGSLAATRTDPAKLGVDFILNHFGNISTTPFTRALTEDELNTEITSNRPVLARIGWFANGKPAGGHVTLIVGFDPDSHLVDLNDPWPDNGAVTMDYTALVSGDTDTFSTGSPVHQWTHTLTLAASLDLVFLIDSTGSMHDDIGNAKTNATSILNQLLAKFLDCRMAVVDYKDKPAPVGPGDNSDYVDQVDTVFTRNKSQTVSAINSLTAIGGGDLPEGMYSALYDCINGTILGGWRPNPTKRMIVLIGDAGGHDPVEPWPGGKSAADVISLANTPNATINIQALAVGNSTNVIPDFQAVSGGTGGSFFNADTSVDLSSVISQIIGAINPRAPSGNVSSMTPKFSFDETNVGMAAPPTKVSIELDKYDTKAGLWKIYKVQAVAGVAGAYTWTPTTPLPVGQYRWRLNFQIAASSILGPDGKVLAKVKSQTTTENDFLQFTRLPVLPSDPDLISPVDGSLVPAGTPPVPPVSYFKTTTNTTTTLSWGKATGATKYVVFIYKGVKLWKTVTVAPSAKTANAPVLTLKVAGLTKNTIYTWRVESLNFDKPKPTE